MIDQAAPYYAWLGKAFHEMIICAVTSHPCASRCRLPHTTLQSSSPLPHLLNIIMDPIPLRADINIKVTDNSFIIHLSVMLFEIFQQCSLYAKLCIDVMIRSVP